MDAKERVWIQALVLRCQGGDANAFASLFQRFNGPLKYYLLRLLDGPDEVDDVLQTVWLKVLRGIKGLNQLDAFPPWLYRIARNEAYQHLRKERRWRDVEETLPSPMEEEPEFDETDAAKVHDALKTLSPTHRDVLTLRFLESLTYEEIASVVGRQMGTVRSRIYYAKKALAQALEDQEDEK